MNTLDAAKQKGAFASFSLVYELVEIVLSFFSGEKKMESVLVLKWTSEL